MYPTGNALVKNNTTDYITQDTTNPSTPATSLCGLSHSQEPHQLTSFFAAILITSSHCQTVHINNICLQLLLQSTYSFFVCFFSHEDGLYTNTLSAGHLLKIKQTIAKIECFSEVLFCCFTAVIFHSMHPVCSLPRCCVCASKLAFVQTDTQTCSS